MPRLYLIRLNCLIALTLAGALSEARGFVQADVMDPAVPGVSVSSPSSPSVSDFSLTAPSYSSYPSASAKLYLDFVGDMYLFSCHL